MADGSDARKSRRVLGCGCLGLMLVVGAFGIILQRSSSRRLDEAYAQLTVDIEAFERRLAAEPRQPLGAPVAGDAYPWYALLEYVLGPTPPEWQPRPVWLPPCPLSADHPGVQGHDLSVLVSAVDSLDLGGSALSTAAESLCVIYAPLHQAVREGLRREALTWPADLRRGYEARIPNLLALRNVAHLLQVTGALGSADEEVWCGLEIIAFGRDIAHAPFLISAMIGVAIQSIGLRTLARGLRRGPTLETLERLEAFLVGFDGLDQRRAAEGELLGLKASLLFVTGRPEREGGAVLDERGALRFDVVAAYELGVFEDVSRRSLESFDLPVGKARDGARQKIIEDLEETWSLATSTMMFDVGILSHATGMQAALHCVRAAVAVQRFWETHGRPPGSLDSLGLPPAAIRDPFGGGPLVYRVEGEVVTIYSIGRDQRDDGGQDLLLTSSELGLARDIGLELRAP